LEIHAEQTRCLTRGEESSIGRSHLALAVLARLRRGTARPAPRRRW
jgi:hypothetical protein